MRKLITKLSALIAIVLFCAGNVNGQNYHQITNEESFSFIKSNIEASDWVAYSSDKYTDRDKCIKPKSPVPNMSDANRYLTLHVSGCELFTLAVDGNNNARYLDITIDDNEPIRTAAWPNNCNTQDFFTNNTGSCTIKIAGVNGSLYPSIITFYAPSCSEAAFSFSGSELEVNEGEVLNALELINPDNLADITYSSSDESVAAINVITGELTNVGVGEAVITAAAPRQDVGGTTYCAVEASYVVKVKSASPTLSASVSELDFLLGRFENSRAAKFTISGYNLNGNTSVGWLPSAFELSPAFEVVNGEVEQEYELIYNETEPLSPSNFNLVFSAGGIEAVITVLYGKEALSEWAEVSGAAVWDFSAGQTASEVSLSNESKPAKNQPIVLADFPGITPKEDFNAAALKVRGERLNPGYWQGDSLAFKVDKPGTIDVTFSNTGNRSLEKDRRYLNVQGNIIGADDTSNGAMSSAVNEVTVSGIPVAAGEVVIYGVMESKNWTDPQYLRYYKIAYTPGSGTTEAGVIESNNVLSFNGRVISNPNKEEIKVFDTTGRVVDRSAGDIDMSLQPKGIYIVKSINETLKISLVK